MLTLLTHRQLIRVSGPDRFSFLQGLVTQDVMRLEQEPAVSCMLLTPQGKYLFDLMLYAQPDSILIEADQGRRAHLVTRLNLYKLRSQVDVVSVDNIQVGAAWNVSPEEQILFQEHSFACIPDPRLPELGMRILITHSGEGDAIPAALQVFKRPQEAYQEHRYQYGVPESDQEYSIDKSIPLEWGADDLHAIDWEKGCYMGQELTARTRYRGLIRKRILPFQGSVECAPDANIVDMNQRNVGKVIAFQNGIGLCLLRLSALNTPLTCQDHPVTIKIPSWFTQPIADEAE